MDGTLFDERKEGNELEAIMEEGAHRKLAILPFTKHVYMIERHCGSKSMIIWLDSLWP